MIRHAIRNEYGRVIVRVGDAEEFESNDDSSFMHYLNGPVAWIEELVPSRQTGSRRKLLESVIDMLEYEDVLAVGILVSSDASFMQDLKQILVFARLYESLGFKRVGSNRMNLPIMIRYSEVDPVIVNESIDLILGL